ncbi:hypothetical protein ACFYL6_15380 [Micromonospora sp. NPDC007208]|uniref:hypothetical protein n=1 Tax=unclassified Micromonospora TaxID=2617518 RepID=UPI00368BA88C
MKLQNRLRRAAEQVGAQPLSSAERLSAVTHLLSSLEYMARSVDRQPGGLNNWEYTRDQFPLKSRRVQKLMDLVAREPVTQAIHASRAAAAAVLISPVGDNRVRMACNAYLSASQLVVYPRHFFGTDGSDQVSFLVQTAAALGRLGGTDRSRKIASDFIGAQAVLAYGASGLAKLPGHRWRSGDALIKIMRTQTYGDEQFFQLLSKWPAASRLLCHAVLALECGFPLLLLKNGRHIDLGLLAMGSFHLANARLMGLSRFAWAFVATYPSVRALAKGTGQS